MPDSVYGQLSSPGVSSGGSGLVKVLNNAQLDERNAQIKAAEAVPDAQSEEGIDQIGALIRNVFQQNESHRSESGVDDKLIEALRQRDSEYDPKKAADIEEAGGSSVFMGITELKCRAAESWVLDVLSSDRGRPWALKTSEEPVVSPEVQEQIVKETIAQVQQRQQEGAQLTQQDIFDMSAQMAEMAEENLKQEADDRAEGMEKKIAEQFDAGGYNDAFTDVVSNLVTLKAGIMKGPIIRRRDKLVWKKVRGKTKAVKKTVIFHDWESVNPLDMYPSKYAVGINDGDLIERERFMRRDLAGLKGIEGYDDEAIDAALLEYGKGGLRNWTNLDETRLQLEDKGYSQDPAPKDSIEALEYWGSVQGDMLIERGIARDPDGEPINPTQEYDINAILVGKFVIYLQFNPDILGRRPYSKMGWARVPGSWWYKGVPELMKDLQTICNATVRALVDNESIAAGPQITYTDINRLPAGEPVDQIYPRQIRTFTNNSQSNLPPVMFDQIPSIANELVAIYVQFANMADDYTGIPAYAHGNDNVRGAGRALADYEEILTPSGPMEIGEAKVGDSVSNTYGGYSSVLAVYPQGKRDIFRMRFSDGNHVDCDIEHRWAVSTHPERDQWQVYTTGELLEKGLYRETKKGERNPKGYRPRWALPPIQSVYFDARDVKIDPYTMGALIGNGDTRCRLTSMDEETFDRIPYDLGVVDEKRNDNRAWSRTVKGIKTDYRAYGLNCKSPAKFIPEDYLYNKKEVRLELLRGLMDTDGCASSDGEKVFYDTTSERLKDDFTSLVASLGATNIRTVKTDPYTFSIHGRESKTSGCYRINFNLDNEKIFHLPRKLELLKDRKKRRIYITGIEHIGQNEATCITVDAKDSLFLCANYIPTHNTLGGLSMLMSNAARGIKLVISNIDMNIFKPSIMRQFEWNMQFDDDESVKGDIEIKPVGALAQIVKEQMIARRMEFLNATNNPNDLELMGAEGRAVVLREAAKALEINDPTVVKTKEEIKQLEERRRILLEAAEQQQAQALPPQQQA
ncbi:MAG TPA: LAGLIDADG family homing endonuclease [Armatimonadota bacterium]|nr:LAGLIDADG family homing endonuclease [Armatimonadota bacterium]